jgi:hypothetical protein
MAVEVTMLEQTALAELLCEALAVIRDALDDLPWAVTTDATLGAEVLESCGRLERLLSTLANLDMPLANALGDVQAALAAIGEELQCGNAPVGGEEETDDDDELTAAAAKCAATRAADTKLARWQGLINTLFGLRQRAH